MGEAVGGAGAVPPDEDRHALEGGHVAGAVDGMSAEAVVDFVEGLDALCRLPTGATSRGWPGSGRSRGGGDAGRDAGRRDLV